MHAANRERPTARLPLYQYFCDFYATLVEVRSALGKVPAGLAAGQRPPELAPAAIHARLADLLRAQHASVHHEGTPDQCDLYLDAQYAMAALADEQLLLEVQWPGRAQWLDLMLETALFDSRAAGVRFFRLIDRLLAVPLRTQAHAELGLVLLAAIEAGFRGALRGPHEADALTRRREALVKFVRDVRGDQPSRHAFEQAYEHTSEPVVPEPPTARLAPLSPWFNAARIALIAYLLASGAIWFVSMHPFYRLVADDPAVRQLRLQQRAAGAADAAGQATQASGPVLGLASAPSPNLPQGGKP
jgi:type IV/VI secretion system ImpK/VasF family protein